MKKQNNEIFERIMDLSAEISFQICDAKDALKHMHNRQSENQLIDLLLETVDAIASKINDIAYKNL